MKTLAFLASLYQPLDKQAHILAGNSISAVAYSITYKQTQNHLKSASIAFGSGIFIGAGKELIYDKAMRHGDPSLKDFLSTAIGSALGTVTFRIILNKKKNENFNNREYNSYTN